MKTFVYYPRPENKKVSLTCYLHDESPEMPGIVRDAMLVLPGGGYRMCSDREAEPVAMQYLAAGLNAFVLRYSVNEDAKYPAPLVDASLAMKYIKENAEEFHIDKNRVFAVGFSAGGHLCAALGTYWNAPFLRSAVELEGDINRPLGTILCYPVVTWEKYAHSDSFFAISGTREPSPEQLDLFSIDKHVSEQTVPAFFYHTSDDTVVPVQNSLLLAKAMSDVGIKYEMYIYPSGWHGSSICTAETSGNHAEWCNPDMARWVEMSLKWMKTL